MQGIPRLASAATAAALVAALAACQSPNTEPLSGNIIDDARIEELLLTAGDPEESVAFFQNALSQEPERADFRRGLAVSLRRARRYPEAARVFEEMMALGQAEPGDRLEYAMVAARLGKWDDISAAVDALPDGLDTARRHLVEAMLADHRQDWATADAAYARAEALSPNPAGVLNNWGVSLMSRGELARAEETFERALSYDSRLFSAKNNLAIARGLQGEYDLPALAMTEIETAYVLNNLGVIALRRGEEPVARGLFAAAVDAHPQHYGAAASRLEALQAVAVATN